MTKLTRGESSLRQSDLNYDRNNIVIAAVWGVFYLVVLGAAIMAPTPSKNIEIATR